MIFLCLVSAFAGYVLNEEAAIRRISGNLACPHEGWLVLKYTASLAVLVLGVLLAFLKGYGWGLVLNEYVPNYGFLPGAIYIMANLLAAKRTAGFGHSTWLALAGLLPAWSETLFRGPFTAAVVIIMLTHNLNYGKRGWFITFVIFIFICLPLVQAVFWCVVMVLLVIFQKGTVTLFLAK